MADMSNRPDGSDTTAQALVQLVPVTSDYHDHWQAISHISNQVVLYNPTSHALTIQHSSREALHISASACPYCKRPLPDDVELPEETLSEDGSTFRAHNYFQLLAVANETSSRPSTPTLHGREARPNAFASETMAEGYFKAFFQEECRLGMGASGTVYLCQHVLDGNPLGHFAVKKIAVGESHSYLLNILKEVRLLEQLQHPNIISYHHAWLETCQFSAFGPRVPTLHVLMQWAEGGSLDDFIDVRLGKRSPHAHIDPAAFTSSNSPPVEDSDTLSRSARIRAFREFQKFSPEQRERIREESLRHGTRSTTWTAVHLLSAEEVKSLFSDVVEGLAFLHNKSILHLDLKPGNVLLTWDEGRLTPRAMLSDFGTSRDMLKSSSQRSGNTGTLEYSSPESLPALLTGRLQPVDSKSDMWSLGMILHKLLFLKSPYLHASDDVIRDSNVAEADKMARLENEILNYAGFQSDNAHTIHFRTRHLPRAFLILLETLLHVKPSNRPSCDRVAFALREGKLDPVPSATESNLSSLIPAPHRSAPLEPEDSDVAKTSIDEDPPRVNPILKSRLIYLRTFKSCLLIAKLHIFVSTSWSVSMNPLEYDVGSDIYALATGKNDDAADLVAVGTDHSVTVLLLSLENTPRVVASFHVGAKITALAWSPRSVSPSFSDQWLLEIAAASSDFGLHLLTKSATSEEAIFSFGGGLSGHHGRVNCMTFCGGRGEDSTRYVATVSDDKMLMVWDLYPTTETSGRLSRSPESPGLSEGRLQPTAYVISFPHSLVSVSSHPSSSKEFLVSDVRGSLFLTDWRSDPEDESDEGWRIVDLVEPYALASTVSGSSVVGGWAAWRNDNPDIIGATYGPRYSLWDISKLQGGKPIGGSSFPQNDRFRWCTVNPDYFATSSRSPGKGALINVHSTVYSLPTTLTLAPRPHYVRDFDWMSKSANIVAAVGRKVIMTAVLTEG
ncbi:unnamed protein product [Mycena citricolor]|uniref:non-specific serine/threonine protein kinase n=1 Tax=Mycena citricolor TaxID=2018698 RepID=A0AAD2GXM3_9AGAR|nr:unnamed protein product [Mycena citricolor]CAK5279550.1 unnamed protein product [Mycena citricolor]